ncbi:MAG: ribosome maturation factor RimM [Gemmatimonadales bacterium]|nr:Ribosome maturation factor RimM [bacterium HR33]GIW52420.1 MAG: ribosome maturation factor RimM [Gemmatimonadales bacterium]
MEAAYLAVARFLKVHGLKGAVLVEVLTDSPEEVFVVGRRMVPVDESGAPVGEELVLRRARPAAGGWLLQFHGVRTRTEAERMNWVWLGVSRGELTPPGPGQMYLHEVDGAEVVSEGRVIGIAREVVGLHGELLAIEVEGKEHLIPFRAPIVRSIDRSARRIEVDLPPGLLEL